MDGFTEHMEWGQWKIAVSRQRAILLFLSSEKILDDIVLSEII